MADYDKKELNTDNSVVDLLADYNPSKGSIFMALPEQLNNLKSVESSVPGGKETQFNYPDQTDQPLYYTYVVPPGN